MIDDPEIYRAALDSVTAGVYLVDRAGKILFWNSARSGSPGICAKTSWGTRR